MRDLLSGMDKKPPKKKGPFKGGQGRSDKDIEKSGAAMLWLTLLVVVLFWVALIRWLFFV